MKIQYKLHMFGNILGILFICAILLVAFKEQYINHWIPCPLCLLQRIAYTAAGLGLCLNLSKGPSTVHYSIFILGCIFGIIVSVRQVLLHIMPGDIGYGERVFFLYPYTWNVIIFFIFIIVAAVALFFNKAFNEYIHHFSKSSKIVVSIFVLIILINFISVLSLCGFSKCEINPMEEKFFQITQ